MRSNPWQHYTTESIDRVSSSDCRIFGRLWSQLICDQELQWRFLQPGNGKDFIMQLNEWSHKLHLKLVACSWRKLRLCPSESFKISHHACEGEGEQTGPVTLTCFPRSFCGARRPLVLSASMNVSDTSVRYERSGPHTTKSTQSCQYMLHRRTNLRYVRAERAVVRIYSCNQFSLAQSWSFHPSHLFSYIWYLKLQIGP